MYEQEDHTSAYDIALLLVLAKFVFLVESAIQTGKFAAEIPVLASADEFDIIARFHA